MEGMRERWKERKREKMEREKDGRRYGMLLELIIGIALDE